MITDSSSRESLIHSKISQVCISSMTGKVLLVTPNISYRFQRILQLFQNFRWRMHYITSIYTFIVKAHEMCMCLYGITLFISVPLFILISRVLCGSLFLPRNSLIFGAFRLITIYSFKGNPSRSCYIYREIISLKDHIGMRFRCCSLCIFRSNNCIF